MFGRLLTGVAGVVLAAVLAGGARADLYAYAVQQTSGYTFSGATVGTLFPLSSSSGAQVGSPSGSEAHTGGFDTLESYAGPAAGRPPENTFTPLGLVGADYVRGDALVTAAPSPFGTNNVAEAFLAGVGNSAGSGSWAVTAPISLAASGALTLTFNYTNQLTVINTGSPFPGVAAADYGYTFTIRNSLGQTVFTSSPGAINDNVSLATVGSVNLPGSGTISITSGTLAAGIYTGTISGSEHTFLSAVPEPASVTSLALGAALLAGAGLRKRLRRGSK